MKSLILFTKKILIVFLSTLLSMFVAAQNLELLNQNTSDLSRENQDFYNTFFNTDCSVPEDTQILHYPMLHQSIIEGSELFQKFQDKFKLEEAVAFSQWRLLQLIRQHPNVLVFEESFWTESDMSLANEESYLPGILKSIDEAQFYEELTSLDKQALRRGASVLALHLGFIERLYPTTLFSSNSESIAEFQKYWERVEKDPIHTLQRIIDLESEKMTIAVQYRQEKSEDKRNQIRESYRMLFEEQSDLINLSDNMLFQLRENWLSESVRQTLNKKNNRQMVIIAYGSAHDLSDDFKDYNFYQIPYVCSGSITASASALNISTAISTLYDIERIARAKKYMIYQFTLDNLENLSDEDAQSFYFLFKYHPQLRAVSEEEFSAEKFREFLVDTFFDFSLETWEKELNDYSTMNDEERTQTLKLYQDVWKNAQQLFQSFL